MASQQTFQGADANVSNPFAWLCTQPQGLLKLSFTPDVEESRLIPTDPFNKKPSSERTESARASRQAAQDKYRSLSLVQLGNGHEREKSHFVVMFLHAPPAVSSALNRDQSQWSDLVHIMQPVALRSDGHLSESILLEPSPTGSSSNRDVIVYVRSIAADGSPVLWLHNEGWLKLSDVDAHISKALAQCHGLGQLQPGMVVFLLQRKSLPLSKSIGNQQYRFCVTLPTLEKRPYAEDPEPKEHWGFVQACTASGIALVCNVTGSDWTSVAAKYSCHQPVTYCPSLVWSNLASAFPGLANLSIVPPRPQQGTSALGLAAEMGQQAAMHMRTGQPQSIQVGTLQPSTVAMSMSIATAPPPVSLPAGTLGIMTGVGQHVATASMPLATGATAAQVDPTASTPHAYLSKRGREESHDFGNPAYLEHLPEQYSKRPRSPRLPDSAGYMGFDAPASRTTTGNSTAQLTQSASRFLQIGSHLSHTQQQRGGGGTCTCSRPPLRGSVGTLGWAAQTQVTWPTCRSSSWAPRGGTTWESRTTEASPTRSEGVACSCQQSPQPWLICANVKWVCP